MILLFINLLLFLVTRIMPAPREFVWFCPNWLWYELFVELCACVLLVATV